MKERRFPLGGALLVIVVSCASLTLLAVRSHSQETDELPLLREKGCHACHSVNETLLGPPYAAISLLHAARKESMLEILVQKIISGGGGNWGLVPMVPSEHVTEDEAREMAEWILELESG